MGTEQLSLSDLLEQTEAEIPVRAKIRPHFEEIRRLRKEKGVTLSSIYEVLKMKDDSIDCSRSTFYRVIQQLYKEFPEE